MRNNFVLLKIVVPLRPQKSRHKYNHFVSVEQKRREIKGNLIK